MGFVEEWVGIVTELFSRHGKAVETVAPGTSFEGQKVIVTGATSGLGLEAAILYAQLGAETVYITARNAAKGAEAKSTIEERIGKKDVVQVRVLDMDTFEGVRKFIDGLKKDITLSTTLLALLIMQWMRNVKKPGQVQHLTFTGSGSHMVPDIEAPNFPKNDILNYSNQEKNFDSGRWQYGISKLLLMYASREIANIALDDTGRPSPIVNSVCPGLIKTDISRGFKNKGLVYKWIEALFMWWKANSGPDGAKALVVATTTNDHGKFRRPYLTDDEYAERSAKNITSLAGQKMQAKVWKEIIGVLKDKDPEVSKIVRL